MNARLIAITGASGGGKSTLIDELARRGFAVQREIGRKIVAEQMADGGTALPGRNDAAFRDLLFERSIAAYDKWVVRADGPVFFDRTFLESVAYSRLIGVSVPSSMMEQAQARRFFETVFVCPPWEDIFGQDAERRHDFAFAKHDYAANMEAYREAGYAMVDVPQKPVVARADFMLQTLGL